jgi:iron complex outermembrane receptor protein
MIFKPKATRSIMASVMPAMLIGVPLALSPQAGWSEGLEEIVVTTRRVEENLQEIPVAVTVFGAEFIQKQGVISTADVVKLVPGVQFDQSFSSQDTRISIRGVNSTRGRTGVATLIDGLDLTGETITVGGGSSLLNINLFDLERIEVIKGPQAALYGRNAFGGAISYISKAPNTEKFEGSIAGDVADYGTYNGKVSLSGPVNDWFAYRVNLASYNTDGYYNNPVNDQDLGGSTSNGGRFVGLFTLSDTLDITASLTYTKTESDPRAIAKVADANTFYQDGVKTDATAPVYTGGGPFGPTGIMNFGQWLGTVGSIKEDQINLSPSFRNADGEFAGSEDKTWIADVKLNWDIGGGTFVSQTSYLNNKASVNEDVDFQNGLGTPLTAFGPPTLFLSVQNDYKDEIDTGAFTQDFSFQSNNWEKGTWLIGATGFFEEVKSTDTSANWANDPNLALVGFCLDPTAGFVQPPGFGQFACSTQDSLVFATNPAKTTERDTQSYSLYGLVSYDLTEKWSTTLEARYVVDRIKVTTNTAISNVDQSFFGFDPTLNGTVALPASDTVTTRSLNPRLAIEYQFNEDAMTYWSIAKSTKPGGFGTAQFGVPKDARLDPETLYTTELGVKTQWLDGNLRANAAIFYNQYKDRQVGVTNLSPISGIPASGIVNAAEAETSGLEVDMTWTPIDIMTLGLGYAYTNAEFTEFNYTDIRQGTNTNGPTPKDQAICGNAEGNCKGAPISGIPENALTLLFNVTAPLAGDMEWFLNANGQYNSKRALSDQINTPYVSAFWNVDGQLGLQTDRWSAMLFATNLLDNDKASWGQNGNDFVDGNYGNGGPRDDAVFAILAIPRIVGVRASYNF